MMIKNGFRGAMQLVNTETKLATKRLLLEPLRREHAIALYPLLQDQRIYQYIPQEPPTLLAALEQRYQKLSTRLSPDGSETWLNWAVYLKKRQLYAGLIEATVFANRSGKLAYLFAPQFWRQGYAYEACRHLIIHLRQSYELVEMMAEVDTRNLASTRLLQRLGFVRVETRKDVDFFKGSSSNEHIYRLNPPLSNLK